MFGLRRALIEGRAAEPQAILAGLDAVTAEDVARVADGHHRGARGHASR